MNSTDLTNIEKLYNSLQKDGFTNLGTINEFREKLKNTDKQKALYTSLKKNGYTNLGTFDEFTEKIFEKPEPDITLPVDTPTQPKQIKDPPQISLNLPEYTNFEGLKNDLQKQVSENSVPPKEKITSFGESFKQGSKEMWNSMKYAAGDSYDRFLATDRNRHVNDLTRQWLKQNGDKVPPLDVLKKRRDELSRLLANDRDREIVDNDWFNKSIMWVAGRADKFKEDAEKHAKELKAHQQEYGVVNRLIDIKKGKITIEDLSNLDNPTWGERIRTDVQKETAAYKEREGFSAWAGALAPQIVQQATPIAASFIPYVGPYLAYGLGSANVGALTTQVYGDALLQADQYAAEKGIRLSPSDRYKAATLSAVAELIFEKIMQAKYLGNLGKPFKKFAGRAVIENLTKNPTAKKELTDILSEYAAKNPASMRAFIKALSKDIAMEGTSEAATQIAQDITQFIYLKTEDRPELKQLLSNSLDAAAGGAFMGVFLGTASIAANNYHNNARRKQQGFIRFADTKNNGVVEILSHTPDGVDILKPDGELVHISAEDINATHDVDYELYKDFTKSFNNTITPEQRKAIEYNNIYWEAVHSIADKINKDSNDIITTQLSGDNTLYNVVGGKVILDNNGNIDLSKSDDMVILRTPDGEHTPVYAEHLRNTVIQSVNDTVQEITSIQPEILDEKQSVKTDNSVLTDLKPGVNVTLTYQGKPYNAMVQQIDELGNPVYLLYDENNQPYQTITDEAENITVLDEKEKILSEIKSESDVQQPQNTEQPTLPESETSELPTPDYDNMPPEQLAQALTAESTSEEAINLLNTTISNIDKEINKLNKKESSSLNQAKNKKNKLNELKLRRQRVIEAITIIQSENNSPVNTNIISEVQETPVKNIPPNSIQLEQPINNYEQQSELSIVQNPTSEINRESKQENENLDSKNTPVSNRIVSDERYEELKLRMRDKLNNLNTGIDPEIITIGAEMAVYHLEKGTRKFIQFSRVMITDLGEKIIPYLKMCYEAARMWPGFDNRDMDSHEYVNSFDMEFLKHSQKEMQTKNSMSPKTVKITGTKETASSITTESSEEPVMSYVIEGKGNPEKWGERPYEAVIKPFKNELDKLSKKLAKLLGWKHDIDVKGKNVISSVNIAPIGGDGTIILWKPNSNLGVYIKIMGDIKFSERTTNNTFTILPTFLWRITSKQNKYIGFDNQNSLINMPISKFAELIQKELRVYENGPKQKEKQTFDSFFSDKSLNGTTLQKINEEIENLAEKLLNDVPQLKDSATSYMDKIIEIELWNDKNDRGITVIIPIEKKKEIYKLIPDIVTITKLLRENNNIEEVKSKNVNNYQELLRSIQNHIVPSKTETEISHVPGTLVAKPITLQPKISEKNDSPILKLPLTRLFFSTSNSNHFSTKEQVLEKLKKFTDILLKRLPQFDYHKSEIHSNYTIIWVKNTLEDMGVEISIPLKSNKKGIQFQTDDISVSPLIENSIVITKTRFFHKDSTLGNLIDEINDIYPPKNIDSDNKKNNDNSLNLQTITNEKENEKYTPLRNTVSVLDERILSSTTTEAFIDEPTSEIHRRENRKNNIIGKRTVVERPNRQTRSENNNINHSIDPDFKSSSGEPGNDRNGISDNTEQIILQHNDKLKEKQNNDTTKLRDSLRRNTSELAAGTQTGIPSDTTSGKQAKTISESADRTVYVSGGGMDENGIERRPDRRNYKSSNITVHRTEGDRNGTGNQLSGISTDSRRPVLRKIDNSRNYRFPKSEIELPNGEMARIDANIAAIETLKKIEAENREATASEKDILLKYVGWGALANVLDEKSRYDYKYESRFKKLEQLLTPEERQAAKASTLNAHYTPASIIKSMWNIARRLGFSGGKILEPAVGIGHFFGFIPKEFAQSSKLEAYEIDSISGRIAQKLYPDANIKITGYENAIQKPGTIDLIITNVPFAKVAPYDPINKDICKFSLHNYFIAKGLRHLKSGGLGIFVTSSSTMDNNISTEFRQWATAPAQGNSDFIGAIRLPNNTFLHNAGTQVTTDILIYRKRDESGMLPIAQQNASLETIREATIKEWDDKKREHVDRTIPIIVNEYYAQRPEMMLGEMKIAEEIGSGGLYSKDNQTLYAPEEQNTEALLKEAIKKLPENIMQISLSEEENLSQENTTEKENTYVWHNKKIYFVENHELIPFIPEKETFKYKGKKKYTVDTIRPYIDIKNTLKQLIEAENSDATNIETLRHQLKQLYDNFIKNFGTFNNNRNLSHLKDDIEYPLVFSLEILKSTIIKDKNGKEKKAIEIVPADILTRRVNYPFKEPEYAETLKDAVSISLSYRGKLNLSYLAKLRETTEEDIEQQLIETGLAYVDPQTNQLIDRETYLSGNVREKYHIAEEAVKIDSAYQKNLDDLKEVLPPWIPAHDIRFRLGTTWIPPKIIMKFTEDELGIKAKISFNKILQEWNVDYQSTVREDLKQHYSTSVYGLANILEAALNLKKPVITYKDSDGHVFKDEKATAAVHEKIKEIEDLFIPYISKNTEALSEMEVIYNEQYNNFRNKKYDLPTFDVFPGANPEIHLKQHQKKGALRCLSQCTLLAHGVGTGKTYTMITAASEMRRLKLAKKPLMVVQNATIDQFATSFIRLYPNARILVPSEKERSAERRKHLFNLINTGDWDAVIIPQSFIDRIPDNPERVRGYIRLQIEGLEEVVSETEDRSIQKRYERRIRDLNAELAKLDEEGKNADTKQKKIKDIERLKLGAAKKLHRQSDRKTDDILTFEQMGIDALFIDEAHAYKRLGFYTKMENIKGIDSSSSKRAFGVFMKTRWIQEKTGGHNVIFATGTPITNTMAEIWTMMKFIAPDILTAYNIKTFDEFATTFGSVEPSLEFTATGNFKIVERFKSYFNIPELSTAFRTNTDIVLSSDVVEFQNSNYLPKLHNNKMQSVIIEQTLGVESINEEIKYRLEKWYEMPGSEKRKHMAVPLVLFSKAKQAAIDLRLIAPSAPDEQGSKVNKVINNILRIYKESDEWKGTQLIFCDLYQSPDPTKIGSSDQMLDLNSFFGNDKNIPRFNLYVDIKKKLIANGIPEPEIAIITDYPSNKRETLYEKVNAGQIRILIGGTEKMGVGVNVQERAYALHHIDAPARPMDIEQRNGRIIRQGNLHAQWEKPIHIYTYGVERTLDATAYQRLAIKQNFINQILKGDYTGREMEEMRDESDTSGMSFSEMTATLSGDQNAMLLFKARHELKKLETSKYNFEQNKKHLEYSIRTEKSRLEHLKADLPEIIRFADAVAQLFPTRKITSVRIGKQTFSEKLSTHIQNAISNYVDAYEQSRAIEPVRIYINELQSPVIIMYADSDKLTYTLRIENEKYIKDANSGLGILNSINNYLEKAGNIVSEQKDKISTIQKKIDGMEAEIKRPFSKQEELNAKQEEIKTLECALKKESSENDNKTEQFRMVTNTQSNELTSQQKQKIITRLSTELNTSVEMHSTRDETPAHIRRQMTPTHRYPGYFDPQTGKVHIILGELTTEADIQATMLHEIVAHKGISELLGKRTTEFYDDLYMSMTEADRQKYGKKARNNQEAAAEYAASFAEAGINSPSAWHKVKAFVRAFLRDKFGFYIKISDNDLKYILWKAQNRFKKSDTTVDMINKSYNDLKIKESLFNPDKDSILFHEVAGDDTAFEIADPVMTDNLEAYYRERAIQYTVNRDYPDELIRLIKLSKARRGVIDQFVALKDFQDLIAQKTGKTIKPDENSYLYSKVYMSKAGAMIDDYKQNYLSPLHETIRQIKHKVDYKYLLDYVRVKHGIERNKEMREEIFQKLKEETSKLFQQKEIELSDYMTLLQKQADELSNKDFSGIFPIVYEHHFKLPSEFVNEAENKIGNTLAEQLWRDTKQATDRILEISYNCNLMSKERYQELKEKDNYYVPLRSWEEERADEVNDYVTKSAKPTTYSKANIHAKGRESKSDDPFLYIEAIANTEIVRGHKNLMKLRLYNLCNNRKIEDKYIITHKNGTKEEQPYPPSKKRLQKGNISEIEEKKGLYSIQYHWEVAERDLMGLPVLNNFGQIASWVEADYIPSKAEQDAGLARKKYHKYSPFLKSTAGQIVEQKIELFVAGDPITITFHEPTIPDTVNGMLNQAINDQAFYKMLTPVTRFLSAAYTSWNPEFFLYTNLFRDLGLAETTHFIEKGKKYTSQFNKNIIPSFKTYRRYIFKLKQSERKKYNSDNYKKLIRKIQEGQKLETEDYNIAISLFIASGGETGYAILRETETIRDDIEKLTRLKKTRWDKFKESSFANFLSHTSRVTEGISRFATFLTSLQYGTSIEQAILDAKNVTVNFNVRGSGEGISIADIVTSFGYIDARDKMKIHPVLKYIADIQIPMRFFQAGYTFFNATIQGTDKIYQVTKTHRKQMAAVAGTFYALGLLNALLSYLLSDDDDELKISEYYKIPEHVRRNNLLIGANKIYYTLPLPQVLRTFFGWGTMTFDALSGNFHNKNFALEIVSSAFDDISPVDVGGSRAWWIPTPVKPAYEAYIVNEDWLKRPIAKDSPYNQDLPEYRRVYSRTGTIYIKTSQALNYLSGGDYVTKGILDGDYNNPARFQHLIEGYLGGLTKTISKTSGFIENGIKSAIGTGELTSADIPIIGKMVAYSSDYVVINQYRQEFFDKKKKYETQTRRANAYLENGDLEKWQKIATDEKYLIINTIIDSYEPTLKQIAELKKQTNEPALLKQLENTENELLVQAVLYIRNLETLTRKK